jgi:hypothetical protein
MYDYTSSTLPWGDCSVYSVVVEDGITHIGDYAFSNFSRLTSVDMPDSVTSIGYYALANDNALQSVTIPSGVTTIGRYSFASTKMSAITIPDTVTTIGDYAFAYSTAKSITIPDSVTTIGDYAFYYCTMESATVPSSVTSIGDCVFQYCSELESVDVRNAYIGDSEFDNCSSLKSVTISGNVTSIGENAFSYCTSLSSIDIPGSVTSIGDSAFEGCSSLTSITIPDGVTSIGSTAFSYCTSLSSIDIPGSVTSIGVYAFQYCTSLESVTFEEGVTFITPSMFSYCEALEEVTIPYSVTDISWNVFYECTALTDVYYGGTQGEWDDISINESGNDPLFNATLHCMEYGDVDLNGVVDSGDADVLRDYLIFDGELSERQVAAADVYRDGTLDVRDYQLLSRYLLGEVDSDELGESHLAVKTVDGGTLTVSSVTVDGEELGDYSGALTEDLTVRVSLEWGSSPIVHAGQFKLDLPEGFEISGMEVKSSYLALEYSPSTNEIMVFKTNEFPSEEDVQAEVYVEITIPKGTVLEDFNPSVVSLDSSYDNLFIDSDGNVVEYEYVGGTIDFDLASETTTEATTTEATVTTTDTEESTTTTAESTTTDTVESTTTTPKVTATDTEESTTTTPKVTATDTEESTTTTPKVTTAKSEDTTTPEETTAKAEETTSEAEETTSEPEVTTAKAEETTEQTTDDGSNLVSGTCGIGVDYTFDEDTGTLTISGEGYMAHYLEADSSPWYDYREDITEVVIEDGVKSIGDNAFSGCTSLEDVTIPETVTYIAGGAFSDCESLEEVTIPSSVESIDSTAFEGCTSLMNVYFNGSKSDWSSVDVDESALEGVTVHYTAEETTATEPSEEPDASKVAIDALRAKKYLMGLSKDKEGLDYNGDGRVNVLDIIEIKREIFRQ